MREMEPPQSFPPGSNPAPTSQKKKWWLYVVIIASIIVGGIYFFRGQLLGGIKEDPTPEELVALGLDVPAFGHIAIDGDIVSITALSLIAAEQDGFLAFTFVDSFEREGDTYVSEESGTGRVGLFFTVIVDPNSEVPWDENMLERIDPDSTVTLLTHQRNPDEAMIIYRIILSTPLR